MKAADFETIVKNKFEERIKSKNYLEGDASAEEFRTYLDKYIVRKQASTDPKQLLYFNMPTYHLKKSHLDFNLVHFEDFLRTEKYNFGDRNDLKKSIQDYTGGTEIKGKIKDEEGNWRSCVHWRVFNYKLKDQKALIIEGQVVKQEEVKAIDFEADKIEN